MWRHIVWQNVSEVSHEHLTIVFYPEYGGQMHLRNVG